MIIETLSTFPDMYESVMGASMMRIAQEKGILDFKAHDLRDWTHDRHRTTDDEPYGGGDGLVMKCAPIFEAYESLCASPCGGSDAADRASGESAADAAGQIPGDSSGAAQTPGEGSASAAFVFALGARRSSTAYIEAFAKQHRRTCEDQQRRQEQFAPPSRGTLD